MLEGAFQNKVLKYLKTVVGGHWIKIHASSYQSTGEPDIVGCYKGRFYGWREFYTPEQFEISVTAMKEAYLVAYDSYQKMLEAGVAREVARVVLPVATYSSMYVTMNARALMNFLSLRTAREGSHFTSYPQREIEMVAEKMEHEFARLMPITYAAFEKSGRVAP